MRQLRKIIVGILLSLASLLAVLLFVYNYNNGSNNSNHIAKWYFPSTTTLLSKVSSSSLLSTVVVQQLKQQQQQQQQQQQELEEQYSTTTNYNTTIRQKQQQQHQSQNRKRRRNASSRRQQLSSLLQGWVSTGPGGGGAFNSPVITKNGNWVVGSDLSGIYISTTKGTTWYNIGATHNLTETHVACIVAHPDDPIIFIGTNNGRIFRSNEDGSNMKLVYSPPLSSVSNEQTGYISAIAIAQGDTNVLYAVYHPSYASYNPQVLRSKDRGLTWTIVTKIINNDSKLSSQLWIVAIRTHPVDPDAIVLLSGQGRDYSLSSDITERTNNGITQAWLSFNGGTVWYQLGDELDVEIYDIVYDINPSNYNRMYLTTIRHKWTTTDTNSGSLFVSMDAGTTWSLVSQNRTGIILLDETNYNHIRLLEFPIERNNTYLQSYTVLHETYNQGSTWTEYDLSDPNRIQQGWSTSYTAWGGIGSSYQGDTQSVATIPSDPSTILITNTQFVVATSDGGKTWYDVCSTNKKPSSGTISWISRGIDNAVPVVVEPSFVNPNLIYVGYYDMGLWRSDDNGLSWINLNDPKYNGNWGPGVGGNTITIVADPSNANIVYTQLQGNIGLDRNYLVRSNQRGTIGSWKRLWRGLPSNRPNKPVIFNGLSIDPTSSLRRRRLYVIVNRKTIYKSNDNGSSWSPIRTIPTKRKDCIYVVTYWTQKGASYVGGNCGIYRSPTKGRTWTLLRINTTDWSNTSPDDWDYIGIQDIAIRDDENGVPIIWIAVFGRGFYSYDATSQQFVLRRKDIYARTVAIHPTTTTGAPVIIYTGSSTIVSGGYTKDCIGVQVSYDSGRTWTSFNSGLSYPFATNLRFNRNATKLWVTSPGQGLLSLSL